MEQHVNHQNDFIFFSSGFFWSSLVLEYFSKYMVFRGQETHRLPSCVVVKCKSNAVQCFAARPTNVVLHLVFCTKDNRVLSAACACVRVCVCVFARTHVCTCEDTSPTISPYV